MVTDMVFFQRMRTVAVKALPLGTVTARPEALPDTAAKLRAAWVTLRDGRSLSPDA